jgi:hypothetical protein
MAPGVLLLRPCRVASTYYPSLELPRSTGTDGRQHDTTKQQNMFLNRKTHGPALFMKFGVDHHGFVVPFLRRPRSESIQINPELKPRAVRPKLAVRHQG